MGFFGGIFKALGFESEKKVKNTSVKTKASYKLKGAETSRVEEIDGVPVYYPTSLEQAKEFVELVKQNKAIILSLEGCEKELGVRILDFLKGFSFGANSKLILLSDEKLYLLLPEGMEIEE